MRHPRNHLLVLMTVLAASCGGDRGYQPLDAGYVLFWDRQTEETADLMQELVAEFNANHEGLPVKAEYVGGYDDIFRKLSTAIEARTLPAMAVGYQSMTSEYVQAEAVVSLQPFIVDPDTGLSEAELDDFFPVIIESNTYDEFGGEMYSFPFAKSVLMLYFNKEVLAEAGHGVPPATWDEFLAQCRDVKSEIGKYAMAVSVDASTVNGMIYSMGGDVLREDQTLFSSPEALRVFKLFETLATEELAYMIQPGSYKDREVLAQGEIAFMMRSSSHKLYVDELLPDRSKWGMAAIPQADPANPHTVLYGPNISILAVPQEQQKTAWEFIKFFTSRPITVRWALETGYMPIRKSAAEDPDLQAFWQEWEYNRAAYDCLPFARTEPNLAGWQEVRKLIEKAQTAVLTGVQSAEDADAVLARW
ncbi:MAG: ABC transporter substrate-binding protein [Candidatus Hydrogenedentes bacterium]|nr:ABC transporter substrate-binding protein [Candidatus Hydrogenedentota bacterium]